MSMSFQQWDLITSAYNFRENHRELENLKFQTIERGGRKVEVNSARVRIPYLRVVVRLCIPVFASTLNERGSFFERAIIRESKIWKTRRVD